MPELPTGTVTFLFTDIEGSTRLLQELGEGAYQQIHDEHARILRAAVAEGEGCEIRTEGDAFFVAFPTATGAVRAAASAQQALADHPWPHGRPLRVRMGMHTGEGRRGGDDYLGIDVNRAARIAAAGHGGQVLLSETTRTLVSEDLPERVTLRDLGPHRLKDLSQPVRLYQLDIEGLAGDFPRLETMEPPSNLPPELTSFVGRRHEIEEISDLLASARLVTLTGPGGSGKTRLAVRVARNLADRFIHGVFFVDLSPISEPDLVPSAMAQVLHVKEDPAEPLMETLASHLRERKVLLVLDNFEQVIDSANTLGVIVREAPNASVLVTSRVSLKIYGEHEYRVQPLPLPDPTGDDLETLRENHAVALFAERARSVDHDFVITAANAATMAEICTRLDGLPLAIELAASRVKLLAPDALLDRLRYRLPILAGGARDLPPRQRTLRSAIEWSYELLEGPERRLLDRLSVFAGGCTLDAVEVVGNPSGELGVETLDALGSLVDHSLLHQVQGGPSGPRFVMLETIREYAFERLEADENRERIRRRLAEYILALAEEAEPHLMAEDQADWLDRLEREHANVRTALRWSIDSGESEIGMRTAAAIWRFFQQRGHLSEARRWIEDLLEVAGGTPAVRLKALSAAGGLAYWQMDTPGARSHYEEALQIARQIGDRRGEMEGLYNISFLSEIAGDYEGAARLLEDSKAIASEIGDRQGIANAEGSLGWLYMLTGDYDRSIAAEEASIEVFRESGNRFQVIDALATLGQAYRLRGDYDLARSRFLETLSMLQESGSLPMTSRTLFMLAALEAAECNHERAVRLWGAADRLQQELGGAPWPETTMRIGDPVEIARAAIGGDAVEKGLSEGRAMSVDEAIAFASSHTAQNSK
jgi:predicted ATPase/class 3 adenylate cyclase